MGNVKIRYYTTHQHPGCPKYGFWSPCLRRKNKKTGNSEPTRMALAGFTCQSLGLDGPEAWKKAEAWNEKWDRVRRGLPIEPTEEKPAFPPCSLGEGFEKFKELGEWRAGKKERTREDWGRGWKHIAPVFGDVDPRSIDLTHISNWYHGDPDDPEDTGLLGRVGVREAHRAVKIWRALWVVLSTIKNPEGKMYVEGKDPSLGIRRKTPKGRSAVWLYDEIRVLVKTAWRMKYRGLAAALVTLWDTMQSPADVVSLKAGQRHRERVPAGAGRQKRVFQFVERVKTGAPPVIGTLSHKAERVLNAYIKQLGFTLHDDTPIFWTRGGASVVRNVGSVGRGGDRGGGKPRPPAVYTVDKLGKDFAKVRKVAFPGDRRQIIDFRRSGAIEADAGGVDPKALGAKMNNTIETNTELQRTYLPRSGPQTTVLIEMADASRKLGRGRIRSENGSGS